MTHWLAALICGALIVQAGRADITYVDEDAPGGGDGTSWSTAFTHLQDGLAAAAADVEVTEVRIGAGTYAPDQSAATPGGTGDQSATFELLASVTIAGGYAGIGADTPDDRDLELYVTTLSGVLNSGARAHHVLTATDVDATARLDGVVVTGGRASFPAPEEVGGGIWIRGGAPTIVDCTVTGNEARQRGGGVRVEQAASPIFDACTFTSNTVNDGTGGAAHFDASGGLIQGCTFESNESLLGSGGAIGHTSSSPTIIDSSFRLNEVSALKGGTGAAIHNEAGSSPTIDNCSFEENSGPGAGIASFDSAPKVTQCVFVNNDAGVFGTGGAVRNSASSATFIDCLFIGNTADGVGNAVYNRSGSNGTFLECTFDDNCCGEGTLNNDDSSPTIDRCTFSNNASLPLRGGAIFTSGETSNPLVDACVFTTNSASEGGAIHVASGRARIEDCAFTDNLSTGDGGAIVSLGEVFLVSSTFDTNLAEGDGGGLWTSGPAFIANCVFRGNVLPFSFSDGAGICTSGAQVDILNSTFTGNVAPVDGVSDGGAIAVTGGAPTIDNCVLWANIPNEIGGSTEAVMVSYSNVSGGWPGDGNISADPLFVDAPGGDLRLSSGSPCIDAGDTTAVPVDIEEDRGGQPRYVDDPSTPDTGVADDGRPVVDLGAFEFAADDCPADVDDSGSVDTDDLLAIIGGWGTDTPDVTGDGVIDLDDLLVVLAAWGSCP